MHTTAERALHLTGGGIPALTQDELDKLPQDVKERIFLTLKHNAKKCTLLALTRGYKVMQEKQPPMEE